MADPNSPSKNSPLTVYNAQTMRPEKLRSGEVENAILSGSHDVPAGGTVNLVGEDGEIGSVPSEQLRDALESGYRLETPYEKVVNDYADENDNFTGALKTAAGKFANEATFGTLEVARDNLENPLDVDMRKARDERNSGVGLVGSLAGGAASLLYGGPLFKGATTAGKIAAKGIQTGLAETLVKAGASEGVAQAAARGMAGKIPAAAAQYGVEGAVVTAPRALTEAAFGDIDAAGESMMMGVGVGSVLGAAGSAVSPVARGMGSVYKRFVKRPVSDLLETEGGMVAREAGDLAEGAATNLADEASAVGASYNRANADQIDADIMELIGKKATPGMKTKLTKIQDAEGAMATRSTKAGTELRQTFQDIGDALETKVSDRFGLGSGRTAQDLATETGGTLKTKLQELSSPSEAHFAQLDDALKPVVPTDAELGKVFQATRDRILKKAEELQIDVDSQIIKDVLQRANVTRTPNVDARAFLKRSQKLGANAHEISQAFGNIDRFDHAALLREAQEALVDEAGGLLSRRGAELGPEGAVQAKAVMDQFAEAKRGWGKFKEAREPIAKLFGISNKHGRGGFEEAMESLDPEKLGARLMKATKKQIDEVRAVSPEAADAILAAKQAEFANKAQIGTRDGLSISKIATAYKKAVEGGKKYMFSPEQVNAMEQALRIQEALPPKLKNFNPSGTASALERMSLEKAIGSPTAILGHMAQEYGDDVLRKMSEAAVDSAAVPATQKLMNQTGKMLKRVDDAILKTLKNAPRLNRARVRTGSVLERVLNEGNGKDTKNSSEMTPQERMQEYARRTESFATNLDASQEKLDDAFGGFYHYGAPKAAEVAMNRATNAVNYLATKMPPLSKPRSPYDNSPPRVSDSEIAAFERRLEVASDPGVIADRIEDGTLSKEHVETLMAVYPTFFSYVQQAANDKLSEYGTKKIPYAQQLKMSMLLGLNLHPSSSGESIASFQQTFLPKSPEQMAQMGGPSLSNGSGDSLASRTQTPSQRGQMS